MELAASDYNTKRPHFLLNYMTTDEFESAKLNEDFRKKWILSLPLNNTTFL